MGLGSIRLLPSHFSLRCCKVCYTNLFQEELCHIWGRGDLVINLNILGQKTSCLGTKSSQLRPPHPGSSSFQWEQWSLTNCHNKVIELQLKLLIFCSSITLCKLSRHQCLLLFLMQTRMITEVAISMQSQMLCGSERVNLKANCNAMLM